MIKFTYTKPNGVVSERVGIIIQKPTDNYAMLDLSDVDDFERANVEDNFNQYNAELRALRAKFGLDKYWKNFKADRMANMDIIS